MGSVKKFKRLTLSLATRHFKSFHHFEPLVVGIGPVFHDVLGTLFNVQDLRVLVNTGTEGLDGSILLTSLPLLEGSLLLVVSLSSSLWRHI